MKGFLGDQKDGVLEGRIIHHRNELKRLTLLDKKCPLNLAHLSPKENILNTGFYVSFEITTEPQGCNSVFSE